ncbi:hypothetical protein LQV63_08645 [Paenibacillus profundus]|uniref:Glycosyltransferase n=1 Tax=Paenibacillus profundus TaxID=1173085 RepID=A0ABS8YDQ5_9BACL|nr:hypothetical protein [Paenibacillus profundus]MCE5169379.1 hypothetical protein [Paenibacillus profundus]
MRILYFSTVNWKWIKQRPHFIAEYLSLQNVEVDYLSLTPFGKGIVHKVKKGNLNIIDSYVVPFSLKLKVIEIINIRYIKKVLKHREYDVIVLTAPLQHRYISKSMKENAVLIYECMDNMPFFYIDKLRDRMIKEESITLNQVDAVITSSHQLLLELKRRNPDCCLPATNIPNAVDEATFNKLPQKKVLSEPNLVYIGTISHWLDWETIIFFSEQHPEYSIYLIGPCEYKPDQLSDNIILLGAIPHQEVLDYIYSGNIMLLPFQVNELIKAVDPVKLYEYISLNKPVVSSYWKEIDKFKHNRLKFYSQYQEFERAIIQLSQSNEHTEVNRTFIYDNSWVKRSSEYLEFLKNIIKAKA